MKNLIGRSHEKCYLPVSKKIDEFDDKSKNKLASIKNIVKQKIPYIPLLLQNNKYVTNLKYKAELFNCFFTKQYSIIGNSSKLPLSFLKKQKNKKKQTSQS